MWSKERRCSSYHAKRIKLEHVNPSDLASKANYLPANLQSSEESLVVADAVLMLKEERKEGIIPLKIVLRSIEMNGGFWYITGVVVTMIIWQGLKMGSSMWIALWTEQDDTADNMYYLEVFTALSVSYGIFAFFRAAICLGCSVWQARTIHRGMIRSLIYAPLVEFFERVPQGRILNILSKDLQVVDL